MKFLVEAEAEPESPLRLDRRQFGRYELLCRLAAGGMAQIYIGRFSGVQGFEKLLAIKRIHDHLNENVTFIKMFLDEARLSARISHPNVVQVIELGQHNGVYFIAMEYVNGESLLMLLQRTRPEPRLAARVIADAAAGLHAAHEIRDGSGERLNVVHRDVSPQNILISYGGAVKVTDFGVARARDNMQSTSGTSLKGKWSYMSPEQANTLPVDRRADIFALGVVLYETTTRHRLFKADSALETIKKVTSGEIVLPSLIVDDYPERLEQIVMTALQRDRDQRYQTAEELQHDLERFISSSGEPLAPGEVGTLMNRIFADRIAAKHEVLRAARTTTEPLSMPWAADNETISLPGNTASRTLRRRYTIRLLLLASAALLVAAAVGVTMWITSTRSSITISINTVPDDSVIEVDGARVRNPFALQRSPDEGKIAVRVSAPGHKPRAFNVPLGANASFFIELTPLAPDAGPGKADAGLHNATSVASSPLTISQGELDPPARRPTKKPTKPEPKKPKKPKQPEIPQKKPAAKTPGLPLDDKEEGLYGENPFKKKK